MSISPQGIAALCAAAMGALGLTGCETPEQDKNYAEIVAALTGQPVSTAYVPDTSSSQVQPSQPFSPEQEMALRALYSQMAGISSSEPQTPVLDPFPAIPEVSSQPSPPPPMNEHQRWASGDPTYTCVPAFRTKSCTDWGEPVWLDGNMNWLPFGVVP